MTFDEAMKEAQKGHRVCEPNSMQKGWTVAYFSDVRDFFYINPITGSNYKMTPTIEQQAATTWKVKDGQER